MQSARRTAKNSERAWRKEKMKKNDICLDNDRLNEYCSVMSGRLSQDLKQTKPFASLETETILNVQRTADQFTRAIAEALKPAQISPTQYNALRILQGAGANGWSCSEIAERMVTRDPDITRLIDRLEDRGLVQRVRCAQDRRIVRVKITAQGTQALDALSPRLKELEKELLGHFGAERLRQLIDLLEDARAKTA
jgi:DNA-binding MarR family transcriptional regulator